MSLLRFGTSQNTQTTREERTRARSLLLTHRVHTSRRWEAKATFNGFYVYACELCEFSNFCTFLLAVFVISAKRKCLMGQVDDFGNELIGISTYGTIWSLFDVFGFLCKSSMNDPLVHYCRVINMFDGRQKKKISLKCTVTTPRQTQNASETQKII